MIVVCMFRMFVCVSSSYHQRALGIIIILAHWSELHMMAWVESSVWWMRGPLDPVCLCESARIDQIVSHWALSIKGVRWFIHSTAKCPLSSSRNCSSSLSVTSLSESDESSSGLEALLNLVCNIYCLGWFWIQPRQSIWSSLMGSLRGAYMVKFIVCSLNVSLHSCCTFFHASLWSLIKLLVVSSEHHLKACHECNIDLYPVLKCHVILTLCETSILCCCFSNVPTVLLLTMVGWINSISQRYQFMGDFVTKMCHWLDLPRVVAT